MSIQPLGSSSDSILKLLSFPSYCTCARKIPFASLFYDILFYFIHAYTAQEKTTRGDFFFFFFFFFFMEAERSYHFDHWLHFSKTYLCPMVLCTLFHDFIHVYSPGRGRQPIGANISMSIERPHHFGHLLQV